MSLKARHCAGFFVGRDTTIEAMLIQYINHLSCGNAVKLIVAPTLGERRWRVLRKETDDISDQDDPAAFLVQDGNYTSMTDARFLVNGVPYFYQAFGQLADGTWSPSRVATVTPAATFVDNSTDAQEIVRDRLEVGLASMIARGLPVSKPEIPVLSIPFYHQGLDLPVVTVLYSNGAAAERSAGDQMGADEGLIGFDGYFSRVALEVSVWTLNAQERNVLRGALQTVIAANLTLFGENGLDLFEVSSVSDSEDTSSMNAPIYQSILQIGCQVVISASDEYSAISDVFVTGRSMGGAFGIESADFCD